MRGRAGPTLGGGPSEEVTEREAGPWHAAPPMAEGSASSSHLLSFVILSLSPEPPPPPSDPGPARAAGAGGRSCPQGRGLCPRGGPGPGRRAPALRFRQGRPPAGRVGLRPGARRPPAGRSPSARRPARLRPPASARGGRRRGLLAHWGCRRPQRPQKTTGTTIVGAGKRNRANQSGRWLEAGRARSRPECGAGSRAGSGAGSGAAAAPDPASGGKRCRFRTCEHGASYRLDKLLPGKHPCQSAQRPPRARPPRAPLSAASPRSAFEKPVFLLKNRN